MASTLSLPPEADCQNRRLTICLDRVNPEQFTGNIVIKQEPVEIKIEPPTNDEPNTLDSSLDCRPTTDSEPMTLGTCHITQPPLDIKSEPADLENEPMLFESVPSLPSTPALPSEDDCQSRRLSISLKRLTPDVLRSYGLTPTGRRSKAKPKPPRRSEPIMQRGPPKLSDYEMTRLKNVADNKAMLAQIMADIKNLDMPFSPLAAKPRKNVKRPKPNPSPSTAIRRSGRTPVTRNRSGSVSSASSGGSGDSSPNKEHYLMVRFPSWKRKAVDLLDEENDDDEPRWRGRSKRATIIRDRRTPDEITEEDLENVANYSTGKSYDTIHGTTCHQCRQKTVDQKTICRDECVGVRGMFCGPCLLNRYGEDVRVALKDPEWTCPPCRGICNCSICRTREGRCSTGILIHLAREYGFSNVNAYLQSLKER